MILKDMNKKISENNVSNPENNREEQRKPQHQNQLGLHDDLQKLKIIFYF